MTSTRIVPAAPGELVSAVEYLFDIGELNSVLDLLHFIESPRKYPELVALWDEEIDRQAENQYLSKFIAP